MEALLAFEAAARHQSFTRAADELALTQSAVGRQILLLEEYLGVALFNRVKRRVSLTDAGEAYAKEVREDLNRLERHTLAAVAARANPRTLDVAVTPALATRWLIPRLPQFFARHGDITMNLSTCAEPMSLPGPLWETVDAAIHFGTPAQPKMIAEYLFGEELIAVCCPRLCDGSLPLPARDIARFPLLHSAARPDAWHQWFKRADSRIRDTAGPRYELFSMLVEAARAGLGVALVPRFLVAADLAERSLIVPSDLSLPSDKGYYLVHPECKQSSPGLQAFKSWLMSEAAQYREAKT